MAGILGQGEGGGDSSPILYDYPGMGEILGNPGILGQRRGGGG